MDTPKGTNDNLRFSAVSCLDARHSGGATEDFSHPTRAPPPRPDSDPILTCFGPDSDLKSAVFESEPGLGEAREAWLCSSF